MRFNLNPSVFFIVLFISLFSCNKRQEIIFPKHFPQEKKLFFDTVRSETIALGEKLFFDKRLSSNNTVSCGTCHLPELAFTDGKKISQGIFNRFSRHNSSTLLNVGFNTSFMFDFRSQNIEIQPMIPIHDTNEMNSNLDEIENKLSGDNDIQSLCKKTYGRTLTRKELTLALAAYMKSLISCNTKYDKFIRSQDLSLLTNDELSGMKLFFGKGNCNQCHTAPLFTNHLHYNLGLEDIKSIRVGKFGATHREEDRGRFKTPTLRNIALTHPYFHNGITNDLKKTLEVHISISRKTKDYNPPNLNVDEISSLIAFLKTLTDEKYLSSSALVKN